MATHKLAVIIKNPSHEDLFLLIKQTLPPMFGDNEYDSYVDSDLWDLPSTQLKPLDEDSQTPVVFGGTDELNLSKFDFTFALKQVLAQVGFGEPCAEEWKFWKFVPEPEFGPGLPVHTVYIIGKLEPEDGNLKENCKWMSIQDCLNLLVEVKPCDDRIGLLAVLGLVNDSTKSEKLKIPPSLLCQEFPPGVNIVPMGSRTAKPFLTTNLIVFTQGNSQQDYDCNDYVAHGDALIVDPGCYSQLHKELAEIIDALPKKLVVFVTHHHHDHVDGLSIVQKKNPNASLLVHENTMPRIRKDVWSLGYTAVSGGEEICIGGQRLRVIFAPGHTDGHVGLVHVSSNTLIVGDHCVGQGSALLDSTSGGNMNEYFETTYKFMNLSPHFLIPMHGRVNHWPKHMLCGYLKNRRNRESSILKSIEGGAKTLFDIVSYVYADVDCRIWLSASSNVRLHVDHLALHHKLPEGFSNEKFQKTCGLRFLIRWCFACVPLKKNLKTVKLVGAVSLAGLAVLYSLRSKK